MMKNKYRWFQFVIFTSSLGFLTKKENVDVHEVSDLLFSSLIHF